MLIRAIAAAIVLVAALAIPAGIASAQSVPTFPTINGPKTEDQIRHELQQAGYNGPLDLSTILKVYGQVSDPVIPTVNGPKTEAQIRWELQKAGYNGPWDMNSMLNAYGRAADPTNRRSSDLDRLVSMTLGYLHDYHSQYTTGFAPGYTWVDNKDMRGACTGGARDSHDSAAYCGADNFIYLTEGFLEAQRLQSPLVVMLIVAHEYGHHVANMKDWDTGNPVVKNELMADCLAGAGMRWMFRDASDQVKREVLSAIQAEGRSVGGPDHGTGTERSNAMTFGWNNSTTPTKCDV